MNIDEPEEYSTLTCDGGTEIYASEEETVTVTGKELEEMMKKQIINNVTEFKTMAEEEIIDLFCDVNGLGTGLVPIDKFDLRPYTAEYYRKKFPNFPPQFYELMEKASQEKIANFTIEDKKDGMVKINEERIISFGGSSIEPESGTNEVSELQISDLSELDHMSLHPSEDLSSEKNI